MDEELAIDDIYENPLLDFIEDLQDFPLIEDDPKTDEWRREYIRDLLRKLHKKPDLLFDVKMPKCYVFYTLTFPIDQIYARNVSLQNTVNESLFQGIMQEDITRTRKIYESQVPALWGQGMDSDRTLINILSIGHKANFPYLQHLTDDYSRWRIQKLRDKGPQFKAMIAEWGHPKRHKHFRKINDQKFKIADLDGDDGYPFVYMAHSCVAFNSLCNFRFCGSHDPDEC